MTLRVFYMAALSATKTEGPSRAFYRRKRAEGKIHTQAGRPGPPADRCHLGVAARRP